ncbi:MAG: hypothetical protein OEV78_10480 [Spirochaetia bacterium]|nr:hypothetical protein [Spirochaetia bacterium]
MIKKISLLVVLFFIFKGSPVNANSYAWVKKGVLQYSSQKYENNSLKTCKRTLSDKLKIGAISRPVIKKIPSHDDGLINSLVSSISNSKVYLTQIQTVKIFPSQTLNIKISFSLNNDRGSLFLPSMVTSNRLYSAYLQYRSASIDTHFFSSLENTGKIVNSLLTSAMFRSNQSNVGVLRPNINPIKSIFAASLYSTDYYVITRYDDSRLNRSIVGNFSSQIIYS